MLVYQIIAFFATYVTLAGKLFSPSRKFPGSFGSTGRVWVAQALTGY